MDRIPEPELMDDPAQALAYARADFSEPHEAFVGRFQERFPQWRPRRVLDLGCGPADVTIRFARAYPECEIVGVDGAEAMLALGREALERAGLSGRVRLVRRRLPAAGWDERFDTAISNSLLHHLHDPMVLWGTVAACAAPDAAVCVMDLVRPDTRAAAEALVAQHAAGEPEILRRDFLNSLCAAFTPREIEGQLRRAGLRLAVETVSDRHVLVWGRMA